MKLFRGLSYKSCSSFGLSETHGFTIGQEPPGIPSLQNLYPHYELVQSLQNSPQNILQQIASLPTVDPTPLYQETLQLELAALLYGMIVSSYYWNTETPSTKIPANISIPFLQISQKLRRPPILTAASLHYHNWKFIENSGNFHVNNFQALFTFSGTKDEENFYLTPMYIEYLGTPLIDACYKLYSGLENSNKFQVIEALDAFKDTIEIMTKTFKLIYQKVDPKIFYFGFRKKLKSFETGVIFEGVSENSEIYAGASAAQIPIVKYIDEVFNLNKNDEFIQKMWNYMKTEHRNFISYIGTIRPRDMKEKIIELGAVEEWNNAIEKICKLREAHLKLAYHYVLAPGQGKDQKGTGGSSIEQFLSSLIASTKLGLI
ncbi:unnamed protein product [Blepharisma stoltei]|uniref:Indoleamine 2,3-dioxygenase n=2 Tax=Blepharisma stoltei TaxID=1481888 RepID=A0AAU9IXQ9_9CILI|nr:unnamed protein product [Blepharisma stoltei]